VRHRLQEDAAAGPSGAEVLRLEDVSFSWAGESSFAIAIDRLAVREGERLLVAGPSGCGKSTLLSLLCGIVHPAAGTIEVAGTDIARLRGAACDRFRAEHFGIIFQMFNLLPYATMLDNVLLPLSFAPARRRRATERGTASDEACRLLARLGLGEDLERRQAARLSVGQQQRVAVARALIGRPEIVVADEPTSALDRDRQADFLALLFEEVARAGATLVMVSHDESLAPHFDRMLSVAAIARVG
jgi:putative ABC transport system ATP-binding protein